MHVPKGNNMNEVYENVYVGCDADVDEFRADFPDGVIIHGAKDPWHRGHLGYTGRGAPKDDPGYLYAATDTELFLNLVDSPKPEFIPQACFDAAVSFYVDHRGKPVLIHCNQGQSRGPALAMYCLKTIEAEDYEGVSLESMVDGFMDIGVDVQFGDGVGGAMLEWWDDL